jgi:hypothetical protein
MENIIKFPGFERQGFNDMILREKPIGQKSDAELDKDLKKVIAKDGWLRRHSKDVNHGIAVALFAGGYFTAKAMITTGLAMAGTAGMPLVLGGMVAGPAIWALGAVGCAFGWARIFNGIAGCLHKKADVIQKEQADRVFKKTPAYKEILRHAAEEAVRIKDGIKKAFNDAVDKAFHSGTESKVTVKKPLQLTKPGEKKKTFFGL